MKRAGGGSSLAGSLADAADRALERLQARQRLPPTFRQFLESADFCGLELSPAIAAIADAVDGTPVTTITPEVCRTIFGCGPEALPREPRRINGVSAGGRAGKTSRLLGPRGVHAAWTVPLRAPDAPVDPRYPLAQQLAHGERPAALLIAPRRKLARQAMSMAIGYIRQSPVLKAAIVGEPGAESIVLRRPDGIEVEILVTTADRGGASARGRTLVFVGLDEASFFSGAGYAINDEDIFSAAIQRVVPYGVAMVVSTPWVEGEGLLERLIKIDWGRHDNALVVARVGTRLLNPTWDLDGEIERRERARPGGIENADREILAIPLPRGSRQFFPIDAIRRACDLMVTTAREERGAGADLGHGHDNSALAITDRHEGGLFAVAMLLEIPAGPEQLPSATYRTFSEKLVGHGCQRVAADPHYKETLAEELSRHRIAFVDAPAKDVMFTAARTLLVDGRLALGGLPQADRENLAEQLAAVTCKPLAGGRVAISAPRRKVGDMGIASGGHCDGVSALVAALTQCGSLDPYLWEPRAPRPAVPAEERSAQRAGGSGVSLTYLRDRSPGHSDWLRRGR